MRESSLKILSAIILLLLFSSVGWATKLMVCASGCDYTNPAKLTDQKAGEFIALYWPEVKRALPFQT